MSDPSPHPHGKAAALLAYALDIGAEPGLDRRVLDRLVDEVCEDDVERARLVGLLASSQDPALARVVHELLGARLDRVRDALETAEDTDAIYGVWGQRVAGGALLASIGFLAGGIVTGGWSALAIGAALAAASATSAGRGIVRARVRAARRKAERTERLLEGLRQRE